MPVPGNHHTIFIDMCPDCNGDGGFESMPYGYNHYDGSPLTHWNKCTTCKGRGDVEIEYECRTLRTCWILTTSESACGVASGAS